MSVVPTEDPAVVLAWWQAVRKFVPKGADAAKLVDNNDVPPAMREYARYFLAGALGESPATKARAVAILGELFAQANNKTVQLFAYRERGTFLYQQAKDLEATKGPADPEVKKQYTEAAKAWLSGLEKFPDDAELLNNLAYVIGKYLGEWERALPYAERAAAIAPQNPDTLDTLGLIYMFNNQDDKALESFMKAGAATHNNSNAALPIALHLGQLHVKQGKKAEAKKQLDIIDNILKPAPELEKPYKFDIDALRKAIDYLP
jgi:tetratricopeptide (TPR) repeat protein